MYKPWKSPLPSPAETKPDLSVRGLIRWLEMQDGETEYNYSNPYGCISAAFASALNIESEDDVTPFHYLGVKWWERKSPGSLAWIALGTPHTYFAALERARAYLKANQDG